MRSTPLVLFGSVPNTVVTHLTQELKKRNVAGGGGQHARRRRLLREDVLAGAAGGARPRAELLLLHGGEGDGGHLHRQGHHLQERASGHAHQPGASAGEALPGPAAAHQALPAGQGGGAGAVPSHPAHHPAPHHHHQPPGGGAAGHGHRSLAPRVHLSGVCVRAGPVLHARDAQPHVRHAGRPRVQLRASARHHGGPLHRHPLRGRRRQAQGP
eukprot:1041356-Prorocentrum_minimum.AAC.1